MNRANRIYLKILEAIHYVVITITHCLKSVYLFPKLKDHMNEADPILAENDVLPCCISQIVYIDAQYWK